jgi:uncharacterized protein (DUF924 family)
VIDPEELLEFWFGRPGDPVWESGREVWFRPQLAFDAACRDKYLPEYEAGRAGQRDGWKAAPRSCLALILLLDQLPRNMFRGSPRSYESDPLALAVARHAVAARFDEVLRPIECSFVYLPYEHSEDVADQREGVELMKRLATHPRGTEWLGYAEQHLRIVERFGRFPHRNDLLGRASTPEEREFLKQPNSSFLREPTE